MQTGIVKLTIAMCIAYLADCIKGSWCRRKVMRNAKVTSIHDLLAKNILRRREDEAIHAL